MCKMDLEGVWAQLHADQRAAIARRRGTRSHQQPVPIPVPVEAQRRLRSGSQATRRTPAHSGGGGFGSFKSQHHVRTLDAGQGES